MEKDLHLLEASFACCACVLSLDETVRGHFARAARTVPEIGDVIWIPSANLQDWCERLNDEDLPSFEKFRLKETPAPSSSSTPRRGRKSL